MNGLPVLMYHSVGGRMPAGLEHLSVPVTLLREQLAALVEAGYSLIGLSEALARPPGVGRTVVVTFDDGYTDFADHALDALRDGGATATLYVPSRPLGGPPAWLPDRGGSLRLMDAATVAAVAGAGVEVGSHGAEHVPMDVLSRRTADEHLHESRSRLEDVTGRPVVSLCYPHGYHSPRVRRLARGAGYTNACEIGHRLHPVNGDLFAVSRLAVLPDHRPEDLVRLVGAGPSPWLPRAKRLAGPGWRLARRAAWGVAGVRWT